MLLDLDGSSSCFPRTLGAGCHFLCLAARSIEGVCVGLSLWEAAASVMKASQVCSGLRGARVRDAVYDLCKPFSMTMKMSKSTYFGDDG